MSLEGKQLCCDMLWHTWSCSRDICRHPWLDMPQVEARGGGQGYPSCWRIPLHQISPYMSASVDRGNPTSSAFPSMCEEILTFLLAPWRDVWVIRELEQALPRLEGGWSCLGTPWVYRTWSLKLTELLPQGGWRAQAASRDLSSSAIKQTDIGHSKAAQCKSTFCCSYRLQHLWCYRRYGCLLSLCATIKNVIGVVSISILRNKGIFLSLCNFWVELNSGVEICNMNQPKIKMDFFPSNLAYKRNLVIFFVMIAASISLGIY